MSKTNKPTSKNLLLLGLAITFCLFSSGLTQISNCKTPNSVDGTLCDECATGFRLSTSKTTCLACEEGCQKCQNDGYCTKCKEELFNIEGKCQKCDVGCSQCDGAVCYKCNYGFTLGPQKTCFACLDNCVKCRAERDCETCSVGFKKILNHGKHECKASDSSEGNEFFWVLLWIGLICVAIICCFCIYAMIRGPRRGIYHPPTNDRFMEDMNQNSYGQGGEMTANQYADAYGAKYGQGQYGYGQPQQNQGFGNNYGGQQYGQQYGQPQYGQQQSGSYY